MKFKDNVPIYLQIEDYLYRQIVTGELKPGDKLPSVRELALSLSVNTNTVQRALTELISENVIETKRGRGNFVMDNPELVGVLKQKIMKTQLDDLYQNLTSLNLSNLEIMNYVKNYLEGKDNDN